MPPHSFHTTWRKLLSFALPMQMQSLPPHTFLCHLGRESCPPHSFPTWGAKSCPLSPFSLTGGQILRLPLGDKYRGQILPLSTFSPTWVANLALHPFYSHLGGGDK